MDDIQHLPMTMNYIKNVILHSLNSEYVVLYNQLVDWLIDNGQKNVEYISPDATDEISTN